MKRNVIFWSACLVFICNLPVSSFSLLSDLKTSCLLLDVGFLESQSKNTNQPDDSFTVPLLEVEHADTRMTWVPRLLKDSSASSSEYTLARQDTLPPLSPSLLSLPGVCYIHSTVIHPTCEEAETDPVFLCQIDIASSERPLLINNDKRCRLPDAHLVLGLNNHHVGSYYWARSAGAGSCMEAPGVQLCFEKTSGEGSTSSSCISSSWLQWQSMEGFTDCNSNDGKRSEWVAFLRPGDTIQLIPSQDDEKGASSTLEWIRVAAGQSSWPIYGVSSRGRPLGSEPEVVCEWIKL